MILKALHLPFRGDGSCPCTTTTLLGVNVTAPAFRQMCNQFEWFHLGPISEVLAARHRMNRSFDEGRESHDL